MANYPSWVTYSPFTRGPSDGWDRARRNATSRLCEIKAIAIHYVEGPGQSAEQVKSTFQKGINKDVNALDQGSPTGGTHFIIDNSKILACAPAMTYMMHHVGGTRDIAANRNPWNRNRQVFVRGDGNYYTVGIEHCHADVTGKFSDAVLKQSHKLVQWIKEETKNKDILIGRHYDFSGKACPIYFAPVVPENNRRYHKPESTNPLREMEIKTARWQALLAYYKQSNADNIPNFEAL